MILGFLGKGGSGKSSVSTQMTKYLLSQGYHTLAVDADHNMDLSYNLSPDFAGPYIGGTFLSLRNMFGLDDVEPTEGIFTGTTVPQQQFSFTHPDKYSREYVTPLSEHLFLMSAGPQHEAVLHGAHCSHSLAAPLKLYLPLLKLNKQEAVVVDEKASVDAVSTGIPTGFDMAVVVAEPRPQSLRVAGQIREMLDWYGVPHITVLNKHQDTQDTELFRSVLGEAPYAILSSAHDPLDYLPNQEALARIVSHAQRATAQGSDRLSRTVEKYKKNTAYQAQ